MFIRNRNKQRDLPVSSAPGVTALATVMALCPLPAIAQTGDGEGARLIEEVVVTARRRDESLTRVPIAVSAIGTGEMDSRQVETDSDLQAVVPGLTIRQTQGNNSLTYSIRGQSADTFSGSPSAVVAYINEVPLTISGASTFYDLESVQVLKGPQGTLFGRNTTGGAVLYSTAKPTGDHEGMLKVRAGNYDLREAEGMINVPLIEDKLLLRAAFNTIDRDGYIDNIFNGIEHGETGRDSGRVTLTFRPNDRLENIAMYSYSRTDGTNTGATYTYSVYEPGETHNGYALNGSAGGAFPGLLDYVNEQRELGHYKTQHLFAADHVGEDEVFINTTTFDLTDDVQLKNILGYTAADTDSEQPALGAPFLTFATRNVATGVAGNKNEVESFSNEFQVTGEALDGDFSYILGLYLQDKTSDTLWPQTYFGGAVTATNNWRLETETQALYAQGSYSLTPALRLTAGYRYTKEDISIEQLRNSDFYQVPGFAQQQDETFEEPSWELGLEYDLNASAFAYLKGRGSFRSGGFNGSAPPVNANATGGGNKFDRETVKDVETGLKYQGLVMERPASLTIAAYKQWVEDVQRIEFPDPPGPVASIAVTANIPEMEIQGLELQGSFMPADWLELGLAGAYTDAEFTDNTTTLFGVDYQYSPVANTPELSWTLWGQVDFPTDPGMGDISLRAELYKQDSMYFSNTADSIAPRTELPSYELINARLNWTNIMGTAFSGALFGKNLADEEHFVGGMPLGASLGHNAAAVGEPRMYGVEVSYRY